MEYKTVRLENHDKFIEKRSEFIGYCCPVQIREQAEEFIARIKTRHWDATHNVHAYILREGGIQRYSDDGEPQGTAGIPVLEVMKKSGITDACVVVTRYFGGIMLGAGGLVRAYSKGAQIAIEASRPVIMIPVFICSVCCDYNQFGRISALIPECGGKIDENIFLENVKISFHIEKGKYKDFVSKLTNLTFGNTISEVLGEKYCEK